MHTLILCTFDSSTFMKMEKTGCIIGHCWNGCSKSRSDLLMLMTVSELLMIRTEFVMQLWLLICVQMHSHHLPHVFMMTYMYICLNAHTHIEHFTNPPPTILNHCCLMKCFVLLSDGCKCIFAWAWDQNKTGACVRFPCIDHKSMCVSLCKR